jgi:hypothetical protein
MRRDIPGSVGLAAAPDFTQELLTETQLEMLERDGVVEIPSEYETAPYPISKSLLLRSQQVLLLDSQSHRLKSAAQCDCYTV